MSTRPFGVVLALADTTMDGDWMPLANISWAELSMWGNPEAAGGTVTADFSFVGEPYIPELAIHEV
ncbi:MAG TPA: hypothetical protein VKB49_28375 [Candidatus Sulfotelmatobacter sp.]|nr:hypothetical protein [Candidatus Sulfotelmatobacter sp.]